VLFGAIAGRAFVAKIINACPTLRRWSNVVPEHVALPERAKRSR
jgi:hypothetical protein